MPTVLLYILIILGILVSLLIVWWLIVFFFAYIINPKKTYTENSKFYRFLLNFSTDQAMIGSRLRIHVTGKEKIPEGRFLFVSNHRSNFDPLIQWHILKKQDISFVSKEDNFKIPAFGRIIRKCCFLSIDRNDPRKSMKTLLDAAELIKRDQVSIGIYPEGTRNRSEELLPFHDGVLKIAKIANVPILVGVIQGSEKIAKNFPFRHTDIYVDFVDVIDADTVSSQTTHVLSSRVREDMINCINQ